MKNAVTTDAHETQRRRVRLAKIHVGKQRLNLSDDVYRSIIGTVCPGKKSAAECNERELGRILDAFKALGFVEGNSFTTSLDDFDDREPQARLIRALHADCLALGVMKNGSEKGLQAFVKRVSGTDNLRWLTPQGANKVIEALKAMKKRAQSRRRME
jgi:phage gp16-like protein